MPVLFLERRLESTRHIVLTHLTGDLDQQLPAVIISEFGNMNYRGNCQGPYLSIRYSP
jgi:hypothetical protein